MNLNNPEAIEAKSFEIIEEELGSLDRKPEEARVIKRVVHATADSEFADLIEISPEAIASGKQGLEAGSNVVTDVNMLKSGINERILAELGGVLNCYISDKEVAARAEKLGITRSRVAMRIAVGLENNRVFAIGNAPTALNELIDLVEKGEMDPDLVVGTPVGFVGASEAKESLSALDVPYITVHGRKGGSAVAASIVNSILYMFK
ncbi:precorrin-8X methylmutase [Candidatus Bipolaricaulota bacterium]|nr:precorrin-8X methylmutase [Candidatus Bipolaricaulota bacterium]MBS3792548.1 precorrin-8X methylmutase [Candidatus Bipolaricaulota bacterium]